MRITEITDRNKAYFAAAIGGQIERRDSNVTCIGLVDDNDEAAGAAVFEAAGDCFLLSYIGVCERDRRKGYGSFLVDETARALNKDIFTRMEAVIFSKKDEDDEFGLFMKSCGFTREKTNCIRHRYSMEDVFNAGAFLKKPLDNGGIIRGIRADEKTAKAIEKLEDSFVGKEKYINSKRLLSRVNRYGGIYILDGEVAAAICAVKCTDGVRLESVYARNTAMKELYALFDHAIAAVRAENEKAGWLFIDTFNDNTRKFEEKIMAQKNIPLQEELTAYVYRREILGGTRNVRCK